MGWSEEVLAGGATDRARESLPKDVWLLPAFGLLMTSLTVHPELELESTEGRFLEPVGLDSQEEFQAPNEVKCLPPADETLSVKEGDTR